ERMEGGLIRRKKFTDDLTFIVDVSGVAFCSRVNISHCVVFINERVCGPSRCVSGKANNHTGIVDGKGTTVHCGRTYIGDRAISIQEGMPGHAIDIRISDNSPDIIDRGSDAIETVKSNAAEGTYRPDVLG